MPAPDSEKKVPESNSVPSRLAEPAAAISALIDVGRLFFERGWSMGTSSNYSVVLQRQPQRLLITASGKDKSRLTPADFVQIDEHGQPFETGSAKPSAETLLHTVIAEQPGVGAVLHTHSVWATVLSDLHYSDSGLAIEGYEMLKGLAGITTHEHREWVPIFDNTQKIPELAAKLRQRFSHPVRRVAHGFLIRRHGLYTWGANLEEARRHIEIFEFLFEVLGRRRLMEP